MVLKVAMIGGYAPGERKIIGGVDCHMDGLLRNLSNVNGIELYVISFGSKNKQIKRDNLNIYLLNKGLFYPFSIPFGLLNLRKIILKINPNIVHVQGTFFLYSLASLLVGNKYSTLLTVHGLTKEELKFDGWKTRTIKKYINKPLEKYSICNYDSIIVCSEAMRTLVSQMTASNIYIIPNGIDLQCPNYTEEQMYSLARPNIFFIGMLKKVKGIDVLIRAIPIIKQSIPEICLYIAGTGPFETELKNLTKELCIEENVIFLGFIDENKKYLYLKSADICVFPSFYEPFGIVLLEAMHCGKAIIASNVGGIPSILEDGRTGLLFDPGNINDLAEKIIILLKDKDLRMNLGNAGYRKVTEFTWDKVAERTVDIYKEIIQIKNI